MRKLLLGALLISSVGAFASNGNKIKSDLSSGPRECCPQSVSTRVGDSIIKTDRFACYDRFDTHAENRAQACAEALCLAEQDNEIAVAAAKKALSIE